MNPQVPRLLDKARQSLAAAELLRQQGFHGFSASRAYYALFYVAEALLLNLGQSYSSHGAVHGAYGREFAQTGKLDQKFHRWLIDAQDYRHTGDYDITEELTASDAAQLCEWAKEFIAAADTYLSQNP